MGQTASQEISRC